MQRTAHYKGFALDARSFELRDGSGWIAKLLLGKWTTTFLETEFSLTDKFKDSDSALNAGLAFGKQKVDSGWEPDESTAVEDLPAEVK